MNNENIVQLRNLCLGVRNFKNCALRKTISRHILDPLVKECFVQCWTMLKMAQLVFPETTHICYIILRNMWDIEFQLMYLRMLNFASESKRFFLKDNSSLKRVKDPLRREVVLALFDLNPEMWIPTIVFPRYNYRKESKLHYSFEKLDIADRLDEFRALVVSYIKKLKKEQLFIPPPDTLVKGRSTRYNDGGVVRRDYERPQISVKSGFKMQVFNPKPLETREVWLPDLSTKISNTFWMIVGRQILKSDPRYPYDDPQDTWEAIKDKLPSLNSVGMFDISAFGLQYPRELINIVAEVIESFYTNPDMTEQCSILKYLLSRVSLEMEDGTFVYPTRGIGLGYYEDLKTIGVFAILDSLNPISLYGDQGILPEGTIDHAIWKLRQFGFIVGPNKFKSSQLLLKWSGWIMSEETLVRPRLFMTQFLSCFRGEFHWERKNAILSFVTEYPHTKGILQKYLPFQYEILYGFEFRKGDSMESLDNVGVSPLCPRLCGQSLTYRVERLRTPKVTIKDNLLYETPLPCEWKRADAFKFSKFRKQIYKSTVLAPVEIFEFSNPRIIPRRSRKVKLDAICSYISDWYDLRLIYTHGFSMGRITSGLFGNDLYRALFKCPLAPNPFESYATGGYVVETQWRAPSSVSKEWLDVVDLLANSLEKMSFYTVPFFDRSQPGSMEEILGNTYNKYTRKRVLSEDPHDSDLEEGNPKLKMIRFTDNMIIDLADKRDDVLGGSDLYSDLLSRGFNETLVETLEEYDFSNEDDLDLYLDEV